jgi:O-antigen/teichoic acid export membrane protein
MRFGAAARVAQLFGVAVIDQILLSGANFAIAFLLIREASDIDYGLFVLVQSALTLVVAAQASWLSGPLAVVVHRKTPERSRQMVGAIQKSLGRYLRAGSAFALLVPPVLYWLGLRTALASTVFAIGIFAAWAALRREYLRSVLLIYQRPRDLLRADLFYVAALISGACVAAFGPKPAAITATATLVLAAYVGGWVAYRQLAADPGWEDTDAAPVWREIRVLGTWSTVGAVIYWLYTQSYVYVLAGRLDLSAVANVSAARMLLMPAIVLTVGVYGLLLPSSAAWLAKFGFSRLMKRLLVFIVGIAAIDIVYFALAWYFRDWLTVSLLHKTIVDRDRLLVLWAVVAIIGLMRDVLQCALLSLGRQKSLAWIAAVSAVISLSIMWFGLTRWGAPAALIGQIVGEVVNLGGLIVLLSKYYRLPEHRPPR